MCIGTGMGAAALIEREWFSWLKDNIENNQNNYVMISFLLKLLILFVEDIELGLWNMKFVFLQDTILIEIFNDLMPFFFNNFQDLPLNFPFVSVKILINVWFEETHEQKFQSVPTSSEGVVTFDKEKGIDRLKSKQTKSHFQNGLFFKLCEFF